MKSEFTNETRCERRGFSLIELLVVISIIALLAGLLLPVLSSARKKAKITQAKMEMRNIAAAVSSYQAKYTVAPIPKPLPVTAKPGDDYSFHHEEGLGNSEIIGILMDITAVPANADHKANPEKHSFLNAPTKPGKVAGVSSDDWNFRDPWGHSYIIAFDLNYDGSVKVDMKDDLHVPPLVPYPYPEVPGAVMVWSMGPDGQAEPGDGSGKGLEPKNKDNIKSWEP
jgi:prepilin-type N-terminal cleavage/methylation domain-containing protein